MKKDTVTSNIKAVVLAAGKGTRLHSDKSDLPKVMREACGKPLLWYVLNALSFIEKDDIIIVVGYKKDSIINRFDGYTYVEQDKQLGTGHAVMVARDELEGFNGVILLCYGDMPVIKQDVYKELLKSHFENNNDCTLLTSTSDLDMSFGRIVRDEDGNFVHVVEEKDCTPDELKITELNTGVYVFDTPKLLKALEKLGNNNSQGEYYITDAPAIMKSLGGKIGICFENLGNDIIGVNTEDQLIMVENMLKEE
ncbi:MAG: NTP transferase domain-containing protein [Oscillospiraceae bacterium]|jgi:UDP-N-acetylglucosamine diphosphorylase/glucosamine-1-phosphate N-acetyltransferase|nr:NTP transferase domain-containing protein [Oscillospiraceae bacterium]